MSDVELGLAHILISHNRYSSGILHAMQGSLFKLLTI